ncbi:hypothetical protein A5752_02060 [Mycobacterium sp. 852002-51961_SCH5331710]|nr:hypothetical protein A5752_02060 [Mycobacterium sp. 852002-51961_SCH5331710]
MDGATVEHLTDAADWRAIDRNVGCLQLLLKQPSVRISSRIQNGDIPEPDSVVHPTHDRLDYAAHLFIGVAGAQDLVGERGLERIIVRKCDVGELVCRGGRGVSVVVPNYANVHDDSVVIVECGDHRGFAGCK